MKVPNERDLLLPTKPKFNPLNPVNSVNNLNPLNYVNSVNSVENVNIVNNVENGFGMERMEEELEMSKLNEFCMRLFHSDLSPKTYLFLFVSNVIILLENIFAEGTILLCSILELFVTILFSLEVYINYVLHGNKYYKSFEGLLDTVMVTVCVIFIISDGDLVNLIKLDVSRSKSSDYFEIVVCVVRLATQFFRLYRFYSRHRRNKKLFGQYIALPVVNTV
ncbi:putative integral membrane protein [Theileria parva strain Muguga]|uniref:putative integral membrane protein n=1 Tax=Theileria parva strain Muguga TaxID=333668 RepID=UPI001C616E4C|nr:putative integral membrane protein [Theileria parva strain Muguga]EAN33934.2 putative integral membrane protein [Theileria parva strain Muguga]